MDIKLSSIGIRILGVLIEKQLTTPEYYPMTLNSLVNGCNQKSNRNPVMTLKEYDVEEVLYQLQIKKIAKKITLSHSRTPHYQQHFDTLYNLTMEEKAILAELFLRGPRTIGEIRGRASRMCPLDTLQQVEEILDSLSHKEPPFVTQLDRVPGQKERRYSHLFGLEQDQSHLQQEEPDLTSLMDKFSQLEERVLLLEEQVTKLQSQ